MSGVAFYCVADSEYFLGAVGLVNSLRLIGHSEPVHVLDCGLTPEQRRLLESEATIAEAPPGEPPWLLKTVAPLRHPAGVRVLIDADMIVTRPLTDLIEIASAGGVVAFADRQQRFFPAWAEELGRGPARRGTYVSSGFVVAGGELGGRVLDLLHHHQRAVDFDRTFWRRNDRAYPFRFADQDVLNAVLATGDEGSALVALDERLAATPPFRGLRIAHEATLACSYRDGTRPFLVHQYVRKPWRERTYDGVYSRLLRRLLTGPGLAIRLPPELIPSWLREGLGPRLQRACINIADSARWHLGDRLPTPVALRVEDMRRRWRS
jgi:hypothetical protein